MTLTMVAPPNAARSAFATAQYRFDRAAETLNLDPQMRKYLREVKRELIVHFPVEMDDGSFRVFTGFRVQHNLARGPAKGGLRYHPKVTLDDARALAMYNTWKLAAVPLPFGGSKGGVICDPKKLSRSELERMTRRFTTEIALLVGPDKDIPAPDLGTSPEVMAWMMDTLSMHAGYSLPASVTGKPVAIGGSEGRYTATGRGLSILTLAVLRDRGIDPGRATVAVQGFGHVGRVAAEQLAAAGMRVVAISDSTGGIFKDDGLDLNALAALKEEGGQVADYRPGDPLTNDQLIALDVDVLVPAAVEDVITADNVDTVRARVIAEGANAPITPEADDELHSRDVVVVPDVLGNAGGVIVSYFEWVQDLQALFWSGAEVNAKLKELLLRSYERVRTRCEEGQCSLRDAAYQIAVAEVAAASEARGVYP